MTQKQQVYEAMKKNGGYATFNQLNNLIDFRDWKSKTPEASVRQIVQVNDEFFRIRPGLWGLTENRKEIEKKLGFAEKTEKAQQVNDHAYYQGLIVDIGNIRGMDTYIPSQDKNKQYLEKTLGSVAKSNNISDYCFTYPDLLRKAKTIDVIWFNVRKMPSVFYEVEHSTDIYNSLNKFYELQDFNVKFNIVADKCRYNEFKDKVNRSMYLDIKDRIGFIDYESLAKQHDAALVPNVI